MDWIGWVGSCGEAGASFPAFHPGAVILGCDGVLDATLPTWGKGSSNLVFLLCNQMLKKILGKNCGLCYRLVPEVAHSWALLTNTANPWNSSFPVRCFSHNPLGSIIHLLYTLYFLKTSKTILDVFHTFLYEFFKGFLRFPATGPRKVMNFIQ